jgi:PHD/YefM family antitoxin component YafN of YafNO toxin-antitoxin module
MQRTIDVRELPERLTAVLHDVRQRHASYVLAEDGQPEAAIIPIEEFRRLVTSSAPVLLAELDELEAQLASLEERSAEAEAVIMAAIERGVPALEARLAAQRAFNSRYDWGPKDSTEILREIREGQLPE